MLVCKIHRWFIRILPTFACFEVVGQFLREKEAAFTAVIIYFVSDNIIDVGGSDVSMRATQVLVERLKACKDMFAGR